jgi:hypothetical protein
LDDKAELDAHTGPATITTDATAAAATRNPAASTMPR